MIEATSPSSSDEATLTSLEADVLVIGGGPAGTTAATSLARRGRRVVLLEKEKFPRFQIGESLLPYNNDLFRALGLWPKLEEMPHVAKYGAEFITGDGQTRFKFQFGQNLPDRYGRTFQVTRSRFDQLLLEHSRESGVDVHEETQVTDVDVSEEGRVFARGRRRDGRPIEVRARFLIDASGHGALLGPQVGEKRENESLKKMAFFAHFRGVVPGGSGIDAGNIVICVLRGGWFWMIPLADEMTSVGVVTDRDSFRASGLQPEAFLTRAIESTPYVVTRMRNAERASQVYSRKDFSYRMKKMTGGNFALAGDAAGFIDPIFSTGVFMAMKSATLVAEAVDHRLQTGSMELLQRYEKRLGRSLDRYLNFIQNFYRREFLEVFMQPPAFGRGFGLIRPIVGMLAGDVFERKASRWKLGVFFFLVRVQKRFGVIAPRLPWNALPGVPAGKNA